MFQSYDIMYMVGGIAAGFAAGYALASNILKSRHAQLEEKFTLQFENLANRIFEEKSDRFKKESQEGISHLLSPLREKLNDFQKKIDESFGAQMRDQISLKEQIRHIVAVNEKMTLQTESLTRALKGNAKVQGNWGEVMLEKILEASGLRRDEEYIVQGSGLGLRHAETGGVIKPDVIIMLPEEKHIIVDAKVSLTAYERFVAEDAPEARAPHLQAFLSSVRQHVKDLEARRYQDTEKLGTPDFVLMFMPIEGAYSLALQEDPSLHEFAWDKKIVLVCPSTLFATLKTIDSVWRLERQNKNADDIAKRGGLLYDKVVGFVKDMEDLGKKITAAQKTYDEAFGKLSSGRGSIITQTEHLKTLGAKASKSMPAELLDAHEELKKVENA